MINYKINDEKKCVVIPQGRIDAETAAVFHEELLTLPKDNSGYIFDFKDISYVSSAGLREILSFARKYNDIGVSIINVNPDVYEIFKITGFDNILSIQVATEDVSTYVKKSIKKMIRDKVSSDPDRVLLKGEHGEYTWSRIEKLTQIIAADLYDLGVRPGGHVGLCGSNSINWVLTYFAIQKLGAIAMLINPTLHSNEIGSIASIGDISVLCYGNIREMADDKAKFLDEIRVSSEGKTEAFYPVGNEISFDDRIDEYEKYEGRFDKDTDYDMPCTVIFTSGSTGRPKGVILSSYNLLNAAASQIISQKLVSEDKNLIILPLFHIFGLSGCLLPCAWSGATLYIPDNIRTDNLIEIMKKERCTIMHSVPTLLIALTGNPGFDTETFSSLRLTAIGGAAATEAQIKMFREKMPANHFKVGYGLSEIMPVTVTDYVDTEEHLLKTVGKPAQNITVKTINPETGKDCGKGESGEIIVKGINLMLGYYKLPLEDQSIDEDGWMHTGDLGFFDEEGYLHLSGRIKELIIRGGENIMPAMVESAITNLDIIEQVKVIGVPSAFYGEEVCACVKLKPGTEFDAESVKAKLKDSLAAYMIPSYFVTFDEFPMLGSGKIDGITIKSMALQKIAPKEEK